MPGTPQRHLGTSALSIPGPLYFTRHFCDQSYRANPVRSRSAYEDNEVAAASHGKGLIQGEGLDAIWFDEEPISHVASALLELGAAHETQGCPEPAWRRLELFAWHWQRFPSVESQKLFSKLANGGLNDHGRD